ncbi:MAG: TonB-dependent receptor domain-containing protein [Vicinamibacteraceae bacterium]
MILLGPSLGLAQIGRGVITGVVTDASSAVLPGVTVAVTNQETGAAQVAVSNERGLYSIPNLAPGTYSASFTLPGMKAAAVEDVSVSVNQTVQLDMAMEVGAVEETVTVTGAPILNTQTSSVGTGLDHRTITNLPLPIDGGRGLESFTYAVTPSVEGNAWTSYINGGPAFSKEALFDGTTGTVQIGGDIEATSPSLEAVEQFKVETSGMPAELGRTGGGVMIFALKSGTNQFHGSAVSFLRNEVLNANTWNNNFIAATRPEDAHLYDKPKDRQFTYAFSGGGPIVRNKTFFFGAFERFSKDDLTLGPLGATVPIAAFLDGDFSALLDTGRAPLGEDAAGNPIHPGTIIDPQTGIVFPGNVIPANRISEVSRGVADLYRQSYQPAIPDRLRDNNALPSAQTTHQSASQFSIKIDHGFSDRNRLNGSFILVNQPRVLVDSGGIWDPSDPSDTGGPLSRARQQDVTSRSFRMSHNYALGANLLHVTNLAYGRYRNPSVASASDGNWPERLGLGAGPGNFPDIGFGDAVGGVGTSPIGYGISGYYVSDVFTLSNSLSWIKGRHSAKFGFEGRLYHMNSHSPAESVQRYSFSHDQTGAPLEPWANQVGFGFASFLLGAVESASHDVPIDLYGRRKYFALYAQDDFRVTDRLTLNLGLRWETTTPLTEKHGHWANFEYDLVNTRLGIPGALAYAADGDSSFMRERDWLEFGPRAGLAYRATDRLVVRGAYGILYMPLGLNFWSGVPYGFSPESQGTNRVTPRIDGRPSFYWDEGYAGQFVPGSADPNHIQYPMARIDPRALQAGRLQQWNAGFEWQFAEDTVVGVNYVGNAGSRLQSDQFERNQPTDAAAVTRLLQSGNEFAWISSPEEAAAVGVPYPYEGFAGPAWVGLSPFPQIAEQFAPLFVIGVPKGSSDYRALQLTVTRRGVRGLTFDLGYTWSRARSNASNAFEENGWNGDIQDITKLNQEAKSLAGIDRTHIVKGYVSYELPFGEGRRFLADAPGLLDALIGGWTVAGIVSYQSGAPMIVVSNNWYEAWAASIYANVDPNGNFARQFDRGDFDAANPDAPGNRYFDPAPFSNPPYGQFGTGPRLQPELRDFGYMREDISLLKTFRIANARLQLRAEFYNVFNRHYFGPPVTDIDSPLFGQVTSAGGSPRTGQIGVRLDW